ncbi:MAG TPA: tRNA lysidine(34) synthetase TilS [Allosphingosinicella sp.]|jgi:tRNA(Ile)-lysidine synthase
MEGPSARQVERFRGDVEKLVGAGACRIGMAVSGGADSLALLLLGRAAFPGRVEAATVDHRLRPESADEADFVAGLCGRWSMPHRVLRSDRPISGNLQSAARGVRYRLLERWRRERALDWLATAHHADDQAETLLMRLNRRSGLGGLVGIRAKRGAVVRPLLGWRRAELAEIVEAAGIEPVDDPSNADLHFDRVRCRQALATADWIDAAALAASAAALAEAETALDWAAAQLESDRIADRRNGLELDPVGVPAELRRRLMLRALRRIDSQAEPRGNELSRLLQVLEQGGTATLAGVKCSGGRTWRVERAPPRRSG